MPSSNELDQAAERVKRLNAGEDREAVYGLKPDEYLSHIHWEWQFEQECNDRAILADAYLAGQRGVLNEPDIYQVYNLPWAGRLGRLYSRCVHCGDDGASFQISSRDSQCCKCRGDAPIIPEVESQAQAEYDLRSREWCAANGMDRDTVVAEFRERYGGDNSQTVSQMIAHIEKQADRIAELEKQRRGESVASKIDALFRFNDTVSIVSSQSSDGSRFEYRVEDEQGNALTERCASWRDAVMAAVIPASDKTKEPT